MEKDFGNLRLSDEAIELFFSRGGFTEPVDLRPFVENGHSEATRRAALAWSMPPDKIVI